MHHLVYNQDMRRATVTIPDQLDEQLDVFLRSQRGKPSLTSLLQTALERFLSDPGGGVVGESRIARVLANRVAINQVVTNNSATNPRLFGSVATGREDDDSDIDLLVDPSEKCTLFDIARIRAELETLLDAPVDVVSIDSIPESARDDLLAESLAL